MNRECTIDQSVCGVSIGRLKECTGEWRIFPPSLYLAGCLDLEADSGSVSIVRSGLVNAINFSLYEGVKRKITAWEPDSIGR